MLTVRRGVCALDATVTANVRRLMHQKGIRTQRAIAVAADLDEAQLCKRFAGREPWSLRDLERLSRALDVEPAELLRPPPALTPGGQPR